MSYVEIQAALEKKLESLPATPPLHSENSTYDPVVGQLYIKAIFLPAEPVPAAIGNQAPSRVFGLYQVTIFAPANAGRGLAYYWADQLTKLFKRGTIITELGTEVKIVNTWPESPATNQDWYALPVSIRWQSDQPN